MHISGIVVAVRGQINLRCNYASVGGARGIR